MSSSKWVCKSCGHQFHPQIDNFSCPECGRANTIPVDLKIPERKRTGKLHVTTECLDCGGVMYKGFLENADSPFQLTTIFSENFWTPRRSGEIGNRLSVSAFACTDCGRIDLKVVEPEKIEHMVRA